MLAGALVVVVLTCTTGAVLILGWPSLSYGHRTLMAIGYDLLVIAGTYLALSPYQESQLGALGISAIAVIVVAIRGFRLAVLSVRHQSDWRVGLFGMLGNLATIVWGAWIVLALVGLSLMH